MTLFSIARRMMLRGGVCTLLLSMASLRAQAPTSSPPAASTPPPVALRESWVPSTNLRSVLEHYPRAVPLRLDQLLTLLHDAQATDPAAADPTKAPPVRAVLRQARFDAWPVAGPDGIAGTQVKVTGDMEIESFSDAWTEIPLGLPKLALGNAKLDSAINLASLRRRDNKPDAPAMLLLQGRGSHRLQVDFLLPVEVKQGGSQIILPQVDSAAEFILHLPPNVRAESTRGCAVSADTQTGETLARVSLRRAASEQIDKDSLSWRVAPPATNEAANIRQDFRLFYRVEAATVTARLCLKVVPLLGRLPGSIRLPLPPGAHAVRVEGNPVAGWGLATDGLHVDLAPLDPAQNPEDFSVFYELPLNLDPAGAVAKIDLLLPKVVGVYSVAGQVALQQGDGVRIQRVEPAPLATPGIQLFDAGTEGSREFVGGYTVKDLPARDQAAPASLLVAEARRSRTRFSVDADARAEFPPGIARVQRNLTFHVEEGTLFTARVDLPKGETLTSLKPLDAGPVADWRQDGNDLVLTWLTGVPEGGKTTLQFTTQTYFPAPKVGAPSTFHFRAASVPGAERLTGYLAVASVPALRVVTTGGDDRLERRDARTTPVRGDVAWFYRDGFDLTLRVERRATETEARFTGYALPHAGTVEVNGQINYKFLFSGVETVKIRVPREFADAFFFTGPRIAERKLDGDVWTIRFQGEQTGDYALGLRATVPAPSDQGNAERFHFRLPSITPLETSRWSGVWAVEAIPDTEITFAVAGASEVDALHAPTLKEYRPKQRLIGVFEFLGGGTPEAAIDLDGVRHPPAEAASAVVDRLDLETLVSTSGSVRQRATMRARTAGDGFFNIHLPPQATLWSLTRDGVPIKPVGGATGILRVELPGGRLPNAASMVTVLYELPDRPWRDAGRQNLTAPTFDPGVPVLGSQWTVRLPDNFSYTGFDSSLSPSPTTVRGQDLLLPQLGQRCWRVLQWFYYFPKLRVHGLSDAAELPHWMLKQARSDPNSYSSEVTLTMAMPNDPMQELGLPKEDKAAASAAVQKDADAQAKLDPLTRKLQSIVIPEMEFRDTRLSDAIDFLRAESARLDLDPESANRGVNIFLKLPASTPSTPRNARITLKTSNLPLYDALRYIASEAGLKVKKDLYAVSLVPVTDQTDALVTREFKVPPSYFSLNTTAATGTTTIARQDAKTFLESSGITFPPGASAVYIASSGTLVIRNTQENLDQIEPLHHERVTAGNRTGTFGTSANAIDALLFGKADIPAKPGIQSVAGVFTDPQFELVVRALNRQPKVAGLLPMRLDLSASGRAYTFTGGGAPGSLDFRYNDERQAARWRWIWLALGALGFLLGAASWAHPCRRTFAAVLALTFFPLILAPDSVFVCNALLAGWLCAGLAWIITRVLLRHRRLPRVAFPLLLACGLGWPLSDSRADAAKPAPPVGELVIVPYDAKRPIAEQESNAAYYLPYDRFLELWDAAKSHRRPPTPEPPPGEARYSLNVARYEARLSDKDRLDVTGTVELQTYGDDWVGVPLSFGGVQLTTLTLDGAPAPLDKDSKLWVGKPGTHQATVAFSLPIPSAVADSKLSWSIPLTTVATVSALIPRQDLRVELQTDAPGSGQIEELVPEGRRLTATAGGATKVDLSLRDAPPVSPTLKIPALARVNAQLSADLREEILQIETNYSFPGSSEKTFSVSIDPGLTLVGLDAPDILSWRLDKGATSQTLQIVLGTPARNAYRFSVTASRPAAGEGERHFPLVSALASREETISALLNSGPAELSLPAGLPVGLRRTDAHPNMTDHPFAVFESSDSNQEPPPAAGLIYGVHLAPHERAAHINYLYQIGHGKIELAASIKITRPVNGVPILSTDLRIPSGFKVEAVAGDAVKQWWTEGERLSLRFHPANGAETSLIVYFVGSLTRSIDTVTLTPLIAEGFKEVTGEALVVADRSLKVGLTLPGTGTQARDLTEIDASKTAAEFQIRPPLERQRAFRYRGADFRVLTTLETLAPKWQARWVTRASVRDGTVALETHINVLVNQGAVEALDFSLPGQPIEGRVTGTDVREAIAKPLESKDGVSGHVYHVLLQNPVYGNNETSFTFNLDLPLPPGGRVDLPDFVFESGQIGRDMGGYLLVENLSSGEMSLNAKGLDPAVIKEVPFVPAQTAAGTRFFRAAPGANWNLEISVTNLEQSAGRAALVAYADLTSTLRRNGEEWHRAVYRVQNRRLQFLPVGLPAGMAFVGARVAGDSVRVDAGPALEDHAHTLLVPLLKTRPGELSYEVELVYHRSTNGAGASRKSLFQNWAMNDPKLFGIPVEKTLWHVYLPDGARLFNRGGNLEPVVAELSETEKLESALTDLRGLSATYRSDHASNEERQRALKNFNDLADSVSQNTGGSKSGQTPPAAKRSTGSGALSLYNAQGQQGQFGIAATPVPSGFLSGKDILNQGSIVVQKQDAIRRELATLNSANLSTNTNITVGGSTVFNGRAKQETTRSYDVNGGLTAIPNQWQDQRSISGFTGATEGSAAVNLPTNRFTTLPTSSGKNVALNDSVSVDLARDRDKESSEYTLQLQGPALKAKPEVETRLSTARAQGAQSVPTSAPVIQDGHLAKEMAAAIPDLPSLDTASTIPGLAADTAKASDNSSPPSVEEPTSENKGAYFTGRISLAIDFPLEGQVYHFKKIKDEAHLTLQSIYQARFARLRWLLILGAVLGTCWVAQKIRSRVFRSELGRV